MKKVRFIFFLVLIIKIDAYSQGNFQKHANTLLPAKTFLSLVKGLNNSEEILLKWDFTLNSIQEDNGEKYYRYRLDHSLDPSTGNYMFDMFIIVENHSEFNYIDKFLYLTCKPSNFLSYKKKLLNYGFKLVSDPGYHAMKINNELYLLKTDRSVHSSGTPNYVIEISRIRNVQP